MAEQGRGPGGSPDDPSRAPWRASGAGLGPPSAESPWGDDEGMPETLGGPESSVLCTLALSIGPGAGLPSTEVEPGDGTAGGRGDEGEAGLIDRPGRIRLFGVLGRGGMGVVLRGHDADLGRDLAVKVLKERFRDDPGMIRRFVEEARIGGQLQHPGVVPVYELGSLPDRRPYIAMRLVDGRTLAAMLAARDGPDDDRPRLLGIFESVCQTMAYAHARGVIHRDLKPSNIMVGSFGEVQVMDWGLAKVLAPGESEGVGPGPAPAGRDRVIAASPDPDGGDRSRPGSVLGTPAYMAPEQARGEVEAVDERADVFAMGSILCEILTGRPAFTGAGPVEIERRSARGDVADAHERLRGCGADAELAGLAAECLAADPAGRPRDARILAERVTAHRIGVQEHLRAAELARAQAEARAEEEGHRRRLTLALAASVLALAALGGGGAARWLYQRQAGLARAALAIQEVELLRDQAAGEPGDLGRWRAAGAAARHARDLIDALTAGPARSRLGELEGEIERGRRAAEADGRLLARLDEIRGGLDADRGAESAYAEAFRAAGLEVASPSADPVGVGRYLASRPTAVARAAATALDTWAIIRLSLAGRGDAHADARRLLAAARAADPDTWRDALRDALERRDREAADRLADDKDLDRQGPGDFWLLGLILELYGRRDRAIAVLRRGQRAYPGDFWLNSELGLALLGAQRLRPEASGVMIMAPPEGREALLRSAEAYLIAALALRPRFAPAHHAVATAYVQLKRWEPALAAIDDARRLRPDDAKIHNTLGNILTNLGRVDEAIAAYRRSIQLDPRYELPHLNLAEIFFVRQGKIDPAVFEYREAVRISPRFAYGHANLGYLLEQKGRADEAIAEYREAIRLDPSNVLAHANLGWALSGRGEYDLAAREIGRALELSDEPARRAALRDGLEKLRRWSALGARLDAVLRGLDRPRDAAEWLDFAGICQARRRYAEAVRLYAVAFGADPKLPADRSLHHRYNAACCAILAACGRESGDKPKDEADRARLRSVARDWLAAELDDWCWALGDGPPEIASPARRDLQHWRGDPDLAPVRSPEALAALPGAERDAWRALWARVEALDRRVAGHPTR